MAEPPSIGEAVRALADDFRRAGIVSPATDARLLVAAAVRLSRGALLTQNERRLKPQEQALLAELHQRRLQREPVARILGCREFYGHRFRISPAVLDPRPDSETLIDVVLAAVGDMPVEARSLRILDLGTGSGCLLLALLKALPNSRGVGIDLCPHALAVARDNAEALGVADRCRLIEADFGDANSFGRFDIVLSNPPYIKRGDIAELEPEVKHYDPKLALDGGDDGLAAYRQILAQARTAAGGLIALEIGHGAGDAVADLLDQSGYGQIRRHADLSGTERVLSARLINAD